MALNSLFTLAQAQQRGGLSPWVWLLIFIIAVVVVWWLLTRSSKEEPPHIEAHHEAPAEPEKAVAETPVEVKMEEAAAPAPEIFPVRAAELSMPDDLTMLEGIGPKVQSALQAAGISTFSQLAATEAGQLKGILEAAGYRYMDPATWPEQAKLLAEGKMEEFQKLTESLKGGRKVE